MVAVWSTFIGFRRACCRAVIRLMVGWILSLLMLNQAFVFLFGLLAVALAVSRTISKNVV